MDHRGEEGYVARPSVDELTQEVDKKKIAKKNTLDTAWEGGRLQMRKRF